MINVNYLVKIEKPKLSLLEMRMSFDYFGENNIKVFIPSWSPGSYLLREYGKHVRSVKALTQGGEPLYLIQTAKGEWKIDIKKSETKSEVKRIDLSYEVYCHELTVRTSHIDLSHAFLQGPTYIMGIKDQEIKPTIEFKFLPLWSKLHTSLEPVNGERGRFIYTSENYDTLIDTPVEIGCHESDGFLHDDKEHHLIFYGEQYPHNQDLKKDMKTIVETVSKHFSSIPYKRYTFITHFAKNLYGGLEHLDSTALHFDGRKLGNRKDYLNFLALVAHEYFHLWNVKRIRPIELGPFDYQNENYTRMHWLTEGLTSFMDDLFVLRAGLSTIEEYLEIQKDYLVRYYSIPGRKFHSLEDSSFNTWIKLYRPDEFSDNSSISYYLKGGLVFKLLHFRFKEHGKSINDLLHLLWKRYLDNPKVGVTEDEVFKMIRDLSNEDVLDEFLTMIKTTEEIDFEKAYNSIGASFIYDEPKGAYLGVTFDYKGENPIVSKVALDSPGYKGGLNPGDEILAINGQRIQKNDIADLSKLLQVDKNYTFLISRLDKVWSLDIFVEKGPRVLKEIKILDREKVQASFL